MANISRPRRSEVTATSTDTVRQRSRLRWEESQQLPAAKSRTV